MRLAPVVMFFHPDTEAAVHYAAESSRTTHGAPEAVDACKIFAQIISKALNAQPKADLLTAEAPEGTSDRLASIAGGDYLGMAEADIRGSGYVVECLEAALWCFSQTDSFRDAVLRAANLGGDADTTAAVVGQVAGAHYGADDIPAEWLSKLALRDEITELADSLFAGGHCVA
jgi:ADP-ribosyl-[dinitrogen reductase] hydrolase